MSKKLNLSKDSIIANIKGLVGLMESEGLDAFYVSGNDIYLNEYTPLSESHRFYFSNFTGSMGECLVTSDSKVFLFVDGRYHEQAHKETYSDICEVVECDFFPDVISSFAKRVKELGVLKIGIEGERTPAKFVTDILGADTVINFSDQRMKEAICYEEYSLDGRVESVAESFSLRPHLEKINEILKEKESFYISASDSISWLFNLRAYQMPFQSSVQSKAFVTKERSYIFLDNVDLIDDLELEGVSFYSLSDFESVLKSIQVYCVYIDLNQVSYSDYFLFKKTFSNKLKNREGGIVSFHSKKDKSEIECIKKSFELADKAIYDSLRTVLTEKGHSEISAYNLVNENYKKQGARSQSFNTISGAGKNSSIIHYSTPGKKPLGPEQFYLLDSGGLFESGYATDTTRTVFIGDNPTDRHKKIYTLVLIGLLRAQNAIFPEGTWGSQVDALARSAMREYGLDYAHGTGHGVGINVHEGGFRLSPTSSTPLFEGAVGSIEPGIYIPEFGGVRLENIVHVTKHEQFEKMLCFENLVYIGFDHKLIDRTLMSETEKKWLDKYEEECLRRGRSFLS